MISDEELAAIESRASAMTSGSMWNDYPTRDEVVADLRALVDTIREQAWALKEIECEATLMHNIGVSEVVMAQVTQPGGAQGHLRRCLAIAQRFSRSSGSSVVGSEPEGT